MPPGPAPMTAICPRPVWARLNRSPADCSSMPIHHRSGACVDAQRTGAMNRENQEPAGHDEVVKERVEHRLPHLRRAKPKPMKPDTQYDDPHDESQGDRATPPPN